MHMTMHDSLARSLASIEADVVAIRAMGSIENLFDLSNPAPQLRLLPGAGLEIGGHMPPRNHQRVPRRHRKTIPHRNN